jgi:hypothetical protein
MERDVSERMPEREEMAGVGCYVIDGPENPSSIYYSAPEWHKRFVKLGATRRSCESCRQPIAVTAGALDAVATKYPQKIIQVRCPRCTPKAAT